jgi:hypothetical protein
MNSRAIEATVNGVDTTVPNVARVYDYFLGGKDHYSVDRELAHGLIDARPDTLLTVRENREFLGRTIRFLVEQGVRQFLDIGTGLPSLNTLTPCARGRTWLYLTRRMSRGSTQSHACTPSKLRQPHRREAVRILNDSSVASRWSSRAWFQSRHGGRSSRAETPEHGSWAESG